MIASWGAWCRRKGLHIRGHNLGKHARYAARMKLFEHLGIEYEQQIAEHEEAGRFLPVTQVNAKRNVGAVIGAISALLHLQDDPESLAAVQYCVSELLRNVLEHAASPDGAFVCAHRYSSGRTPRVSIAVADCGQGIASHLGQVVADASTSDETALRLAMRPGVTGAKAGLYGTPDNAGAGLFITRCIARGTGGYFLVLSGNAGYRMRRALRDEDQLALYTDAFSDPRSDRWRFPQAWKGTVVAVEIRTEQIAHYEGFFQWIFEQIPGRSSAKRRIHFT